MQKGNLIWNPVDWLADKTVKWIMGTKPQFQTASQFMASETDTHHTLILGNSGSGKSVLLMEMARQRGISYEELMKEMEPSAEEKEHVRTIQEQRDSTKAKRLDAVRLAWWDMTPAGDSELYSFSDALASLIPELTDPTHDQQKMVFMLLPPEIVGGVIQWGLDDTGVRDDIYVYLRDHIQDVRTVLGFAATPTSSTKITG